VGLKKAAAVIGVPMDFGASKKGADAGPEAIRRTDLIAKIKALGWSASDRGDIPVPERPKSAGEPKARFLAPILKVCSALAAETQKAHKAGELPIVLGGDHALGLGSVAGASRHYASQGKSIGLLWVDAHGDMNTPATSPTGNVHGMPLAALVGMGDKRMTGLGGPGPKVRPRNVCLIGSRDLDAAERKNIRESGVNIFTMKDIDVRGMASVVEEALELAGRDAERIHVSFDIDAVDPAIAQGTGTHSRGGLTYRESHLLMEMVADSHLLSSLDMVEVNPLEDVHNNTAELACELIQSALGKRIY